ncbi:MAG TPA: dihydrolipoamide acetyltransferase family protein [Streptosporangiaceae bacterium]|nr:dihydrolipoamide acetyltransferase family protein [Streptosporangiaceae bacterium]
MPDFLLPDLGEGLDDAEVIAWRIAVGDHVTIDQVIAEVETAKAVVEVPVPYTGIITKLHAEPGETLAVGQPLVTVTTAADAPAGFREPGVVTPARIPATVGVNAGESGGEAGGEEASGSVLIGYGTTAAPPRRRRGTRRPAAASSPAMTTPPAAAPQARAAASPATPAPATSSDLQAPSVPPATPQGPARPGRVAVISPLVRKIARDAGLDLTTIQPTGPEGVVSRRDVRLAIAGRTAPLETAAPETAPPATAQPAAAGLPAPGERRIPLRGARRAAADKFARSRREIPEATVWVDVDATELVETRRMLNARDPQRPVSLLALLARFSIAGLRKYPELNARVEPEEIVISDRVNLGFAAQTEHGLVVLVVFDAHLLSTRDLSARLTERTAAARERRLAPADMAGGTFTVNNYGVFGVDGSAAIINHPEVAILGMGRVIDRPWVTDGQLAVRKVTELTLSFDHRACDGGTAGGFLRFVADCIESPATALGDM